MGPSESTSPDWSRLVVSPSQAPTDRDLRKFSGSSTAVANEVAVTAPTPGTDIRIGHAALRRALLDREVIQQAKADETAHRLMTIPGIGPVTAVALTALAPPAQTFRRGRDFAAWVGLTPLQHSTGGKQKLGATSKMGERTLRRLLIIGASTVLRWAARHGAPAGSWMARMLACKPPMLVRVALANKMARIVWALMAKGGTYQAPVASA